MLHPYIEKHEISENIIDLDQVQATDIPKNARHLYGPPCRNL